MKMETIVLLFILSIAGNIALMMALNMRPYKGVKTTVEHEYNVSDDYERLYDLLMDGRKVVILTDGNYASVAEKYTNFNKSYTFWGFGANSSLENIGKDDFTYYCKFKKVKYFDQIDKYQTYLNLK